MVRSLSSEVCSRQSLVVPRYPFPVPRVLQLSAIPIIGEFNAVAQGSFRGPPKASDPGDIEQLLRCAIRFRFVVDKRAHAANNLSKDS